MKNMSLRAKITLWFSSVLIVIAVITFAVILSVSGRVIQSSIQDQLITAVDDNADEVELSHDSISSDDASESDDSEASDDADESDDKSHGVGSGHTAALSGSGVEVDDDFMENVNGVTTSIYSSGGKLIYGSDPLSGADMPAFSDGNVSTVKYQGVTYYIYDRRLSGEHHGGIWLRGVISDSQGTAQISAIARLSLIALPLLILIAILGGWLIAGRSMKPVRQLTETAEEISQGSDLKKRISLGKGSDEIHRLADSFDAMFGRLDRAFTAEKQFTSDASHELRTPLAVITSQCEYTLEAPRTADEYVEALETVQRQSARMTGLVSDMLSFTRIEQNAGKMVFGAVDLTALTQSICSDMALIADKGISLRFDAEDGVTVRGNADLLTRLLTNLIGNAYRYGRENGHIDVTLRKEGGSALLTVEDDGIGISADDLPKIFDRFYRADKSRSVKGTGLGLSIVKEIADLHGGTVNVESEPGKGSKFTFKSPCIQG